MLPHRVVFIGACCAAVTAAATYGGFFDVYGGAGQQPSNINAVVQSKDFLYVAGSFTSVGGNISASGVAALELTRGRWQAVSAEAIVGIVRDLAVDWIDGSLYACGSFSTTTFGTQLSNVARLNSSGLWEPLERARINSTFDLNGPCVSIKAYSESAGNRSVVAAGAFSAAGGVANTSNVAMFNYMTGSWQPLNRMPQIPGTSVSTVLTFVAPDSGSAHIWLGGSFGLMFYDSANASSPSAWTVCSNFDGVAVTALHYYDELDTPVNDGYVWIGGNFSTVCSATANGLAVVASSTEDGTATPVFTNTTGSGRFSVEAIQQLGGKVGVAGTFPGLTPSNFGFVDVSGSYGAVNSYYPWYPNIKIDGRVLAMYANGTAARTPDATTDLYAVGSFTNASFINNNSAVLTGLNNIVRINPIWIPPSASPSVSPSTSPSVSPSPSPSISTTASPSASVSTSPSISAVPVDDTVKIFAPGSKAYVAVGIAIIACILILGLILTIYCLCKYVRTHNKMHNDELSGLELNGIVVPANRAAAPKRDLADILAVKREVVVTQAANINNGPTVARRR